MAMTCDECMKPAIARGKCAMHYARWARTFREAGLPLPPKPPRARKERPQCSVDGCEKHAKTRGWCSMHYWRWQHFGDMELVPKPVKTCAVEGCPDPVRGRGWCLKHYTRWIRNGDPLIVQAIRGDDRTRFESHVDRSGGPDACHPWTASKDSGGYGTISMAGHSRQAHVVGWEFENGPKPPRTNLDHECHNRAVRDGSCQPGECPHRLCCNLAHVVLKTPAEHRRDTEQWAMPSGSRRRLTDEQKQAIRDLLATGHTARWIAQQFEIHPATVTNVKLGRLGHRT
jgi:hypothetical protein